MGEAPNLDGRVLRLITWNTARRRSKIVEQATALAGRTPSIVALQEITPQTVPLWRRAFALMGLEHVRSTLDAKDPARRRAARRTTGVMVAARTPLDDVDRPL